MGFNLTVPTFSSGQALPSATFDTYIVGGLNGIQAAWTSYTPALTATITNPTIGTGSAIAGAYSQIGKSIDAAVNMTFGTSGFVAGSGSYLVSLPVAANTGFVVVGTGYFLDSSTNTKYVVVARLQTSTTVFLYMDASTVGLTATAPVVPANSDAIELTLRYQAA